MKAFNAFDLANFCGLQNVGAATAYVERHAPQLFDWKLLNIEIEEMYADISRYSLSNETTLEDALKVINSVDGTSLSYDDYS